MPLLTGLAAGALLGIMFAPDKGWKTRARMKKAAENGFEDLKESASEFSEKVGDTIVSGLDKLETAIRKEAPVEEPADIEEEEADDQSAEQ